MKTPIHRLLLASAACALLTSCEVKVSSPAADKTGAPSAAAPAAPTGLEIRALYLAGSPDAQFSLISFRGRVLVLAFVQLAHAPSKAMLDELGTALGQWNGQPVSAVAMAVNRGERDALAAPAQALNLSFPVAWADESVHAAFPDLRAVPSLVLIDRRGQIRKTMPGVVPPEQLKSEVAALLAEP